MAVDNGYSPRELEGSGGGPESLRDKVAGQGPGTFADGRAWSPPFNEAAVHCLRRTAPPAYALPNSTALLCATPFTPKQSISRRSIGTLVHDIHEPGTF